MANQWFRIRKDDNTRRTIAKVEAATHAEAATAIATNLYDRRYALRMSSWNGRDGVFAALNDKTGAEEERYFVEAEDGSGRIVVPPSFPPSMTHEDAKKLATKTQTTIHVKTKSVTKAARTTKGKTHGKLKRKRRKN